MLCLADGGEPINNAQVSRSALRTDGKPRCKETSTINATARIPTTQLLSIRRFHTSLAGEVSQVLSARCDVFNAEIGAREAPLGPPNAGSDGCCR